MHIRNHWRQGTVLQFSYEIEFKCLTHSAVSVLAHTWICVCMIKPSLTWQGPEKASETAGSHKCYENPGQILKATKEEMASM